MPDIFAFVCAGIYGKLKGQEFIQEGEPQLFAYGVCILIAQPFRLFQQLCGLLFISALTDCKGVIAEGYGIIHIIRGDKGKPLFVVFTGSLELPADKINRADIAIGYAIGRVEGKSLFIAGKSFFMCAQAAVCPAKPHPDIRYIFVCKAFKRACISREVCPC